VTPQNFATIVAILNSEGNVIIIRDSVSKEHTTIKPIHWMKYISDSGEHGWEYKGPGPGYLVDGNTVISTIVLQRPNPSQFGSEDL
jgi:hypothetical protein